MIYQRKEFVLKDGTKVVFKTPEVSDAKQLLDSITAVCDATDYLLSASEDFQRYYENLTIEEDFIASYEKNANILVAAYINDKIVGSVSLDFKTHQKDRHRAVIGIAIQKPYWNKGIGSIMFDEMIKIAKEKGIEQIELDVINDNERAKRLYTKKGFVKVGDIPHQLKLKDGRYLNGELMVLFLNK